MTAESMTRGKRSHADTDWRVRQAKARRIEAVLTSRPSETALTWTHLLISGLITIPLLWVFTSVLATAVSRYAGAGVIVTGLPLIRLIAWICYPLTRPVSFRCSSKST